MARNPKKNPTAPGRKTRSVRPARRKLTEVERVRRFLLDSGFRKMTTEEMRRSPVVAALEDYRSLVMP
jgi:hypothetical protein